MQTPLLLVCVVALLGCGAESPSNSPPPVDGATVPPVTTCPTERDLQPTIFVFTACDVWPETPRFVSLETCGQRNGLTSNDIRSVRSSHPEANRCGQRMGLVLPRDVIRR